MPSQANLREMIGVESGPEDGPIADRRGNLGARRHLGLGRPAITGRSWVDREDLEPRGTLRARTRSRWSPIQTTSPSMLAPYPTHALRMRRYRPRTVSLASNLEETENIGLAGFATNVQPRIRQVAGPGAGSPLTSCFDAAQLAMVGGERRNEHASYRASSRPQDSEMELDETETKHPPSYRPDQGRSERRVRRIIGRYEGPNGDDDFVMTGSYDSDRDDVRCDAKERGTKRSGGGELYRRFGRPDDRTKDDDSSDQESERSKDRSKMEHRRPSSRYRHTSPTRKEPRERDPPARGRRRSYSDESSDAESRSSSDSEEEDKYRNGNHESGNRHCRSGRSSDKSFDMNIIYADQDKPKREEFDDAHHPSSQESDQSLFTRENDRPILELILQLALDTIRNGFEYRKGLRFVWADEEYQETHIWAENQIFAEWEALDEMLDSTTSSSTSATAEQDAEEAWRRVYSGESPTSGVPGGYMDEHWSSAQSWADLTLQQYGVSCYTQDDRDDTYRESLRRDRYPIEHHDNERGAYQSKPSGKLRRGVSPSEVEKRNCLVPGIDERDETRARASVRKAKHQLLQRNEGDFEVASRQMETPPRTGGSKLLDRIAHGLPAPACRPPSPPPTGEQASYLVPHGGWPGAKTCYQWRDGTCFLGLRCKFAHPVGLFGLNKAAAPAWIRPRDPSAQMSTPPVQPHATPPAPFSSNKKAKPKIVVNKIYSDLDLAEHVKVKGFVTCIPCERGLVRANCEGHLRSSAHKKAVKQWYLDKALASAAQVAAPAQDYSPEHLTAGEMTLEQSIQATKHMQKTLKAQKQQKRDDGSPIPIVGKIEHDGPPITDEEEAGPNRASSAEYKLPRIPFDSPSPRDPAQTSPNDRLRAPPTAINMLAVPFLASSFLQRKSRIVPGGVLDRRPKSEHFFDSYPEVSPDDDGEEMPKADVGMDVDANIEMESAFVAPVAPAEAPVHEDPLALHNREISETIDAHAQLGAPSPGDHTVPQPHRGDTSPPETQNAMDDAVQDANPEKGRTADPTFSSGDESFHDALAGEGEAGMIEV